MKKLFSSLILVFVISILTIFSVGCSDGSYTYDSIQTLEVYENGVDRSEAYRNNSTVQSMLQSRKQMFKDYSIKITPTEIVLVSENDETRWKYKNMDYKLMVDMNE